MDRNQNSRVGRSANSLKVTLVAIVFFATIAGVLVFTWSRGDLNGLICGGYCPASNATAPAGMRSAEVGDASPSSVSSEAPDLDAAIQAASRAAANPALGNNVGVAVASVDGEAELKQLGSGAYIPASTTKVLTGFAALAALDPQLRPVTKVVRDSTGLTLVGGGDPFLTDARGDDDPRVWRAELSTLAERTTAELDASGAKAAAMTLSYDDSFFEGPRLSPGWKSTYVSDNVVTPISALWVDRGMLDPGRPETTPRRPNPSLHAAETFATYLRAEGVSITGSIEAAEASTAASEVARVSGSTISQIVEQMIRVSDDEAAESLLRMIGRERGNGASFAGGAKAVKELLAEAEITTDGLVLDDGSGLARSNRISPRTLIETLRASLASGRFAAVVEDLPVSGFSGSLTNRLPSWARGIVRGKTGTLTGVHSLTGIALDSQGRPALYAIMADQTDEAQPFVAQAAVDGIAAAITVRNSTTSP